MTAKPTLHPLAAQHLRELKERWGVDPTVEESIWIVRLCERVLCPCEGERSDLCGFPVRAGISSVYLWPFTIGASVWYQDCAAKWWGDSQERMTMALGYALANGRDADAMKAVSRGREQAELRIKAWSAELTCTREELEASFDTVLPKIKAKSGESVPINWEDIVGELEAVTGIPCDHWLWDMSREATIRAWCRARSVERARSGASSSSALDPLNMALQELAEAKAEIIAAHKPQEPTP